MSVSARNQLPGTVAIVRTGSVNDEIEISLENGGTLVAVVTGSSRQALGLEQGRAVAALIKAPWIVLASEDCGMTFSARNQFAGRVMTVEKGYRPDKGFCRHACRKKYRVKRSLYTGRALLSGALLLPARILLVEIVYKPV